MRKLMWFTLGFGTACAVCAYGWFCEGLAVPAAIFAILFLGLLLLSKNSGLLKAAAIICLGVGMGLGWFQFYADRYLASPTELDGTVCEVSADCTDYGYSTDYGTAVEGVLELEGAPYRAKFYLNQNVEAEPGDRLSGKFEFRVTTQDHEEGATYHQGKGILLLAYQEEDAVLEKFADIPLWTYPAILRRSISNLIADSFPADVAPFAKALLLGDRTELDYETNTSFKVSGIMHIIAVSGLHVTILFSLINLMCLKRRWLVAFLGIPALVLFAAVAGFSASVTRACIMQCLMILAMLFNREYDGPTELAFASLAMLVFNPLVITSVSFQLSVGCMIGIFAFQKRIQEWLTERISTGKEDPHIRLKRWFSGSVSMTLSAISLTTPLSAYYFGAVSLVGILTNLLTLWIVSLIFYGIILTCAAGVFLPAAAGIFGAVLAWPIRYVLAVSGILARFPFACVYTRSDYVIAWLVFVYVLLGIFWFSKKKKPAVLTGCVVFGLAVSLTASWLEPRIDNCRLTVLNVGQGQSIILQSEGKTYLVDCGGSDDEDAADMAAETLLSQGTFRLDGLILTHFDRDHAGGAAYLLSRIPADMILVPDCEDSGGLMQTLERLAPGAVFGVDEDLQICYGDTVISVFAPVLPDSGNESSLAVLFQRENCDILITGDRTEFGERMLLQNGNLPQLDVLVAGHHGSKYATSEALLAATRPRIVAISVGENSYGHPAEELLQRLERYGCVVFRTDLDGNLIFRR